MYQFLLSLNRPHLSLSLTHNTQKIANGEKNQCSKKETTFYFALVQHVTKVVKNIFQLKENWLFFAVLNNNKLTLMIICVCLGRERRKSIKKRLVKIKSILHHIWNTDLYLFDVLSTGFFIFEVGRWNGIAHCLKITQNVTFGFKMTCLVITLIDLKLQVFQNSPKLTVFDIFD